MAKSIWNFAYFSWATAFGFYVLWHQDFFPPCLGGKGEFDLGWKGFPFKKHPYLLKEYILWTMGYHVGSLVNHFLGPKRNDFLEMALHHVVALYLFCGMYMFNAWEPGAVIALLHDIADISGNFVKFLSETRY